ncbi:type I-E CRISPR-associated protein Cas7/Cse4/CasC, partial [uncultured Anaerotruncus sp.]|uniref:type I-E CRISPR-associated protein Cas7/Cse4/CasC n=1 Tax=uncultured Anaerotruncus sp. TaxID=905011 RepID=UPI00338F8EDE
MAQGPVEIECGQFFHPYILHPYDTCFSISHKKSESYCATSRNIAAKQGIFCPPSHAISTHKSVPEIDYFTALDDMRKP